MRTFFPGAHQVPAACWMHPSLVPKIGSPRQIRLWKKAAGGVSQAVEQGPV